MFRTIQTGLRRVSGTFVRTVFGPLRNKALANQAHEKKRRGFAHLLRQPPTKANTHEGNRDTLRVTYNTKGQCVMYYVFQYQDTHRYGHMLRHISKSDVE